MDLQLLAKQHEELHVLADRFLAAVADESTARGLGGLRWRFARLLMGHLALEDRIFYPGVERMDDPELRAVAGRLQAEIGSLAHRFTAYMERWDDDWIERQWPLFCRETREIVTVMMERIDKEERLLLPLLNRHQETPVEVRRFG